MTSFAKGAVVSLVAMAVGGLAHAQTPLAAPDRAVTNKPAAGAAIDAGLDDQPNMAIDPAKPFGEFDILAAGSSPASVQAWSVKLTDTQKADLKTRCDKITASDQSLYPASARSFCQVFASATAGPSPVNLQQVR